MVSYALGTMDWNDIVLHRFKTVYLLMALRGMLWRGLVAHVHMW